MPEHLLFPTIEELPTGGRPPLAAGLAEAPEVLQREDGRDGERRSLLVLFTDGRTTAGPGPHTAAGLRSPGVASFVVDTEEGRVRLGMAAGVAKMLGARCLEDLRAEAPVETLVERRSVA